MPITSTKNLSLSSGFGVSISMWPRWARSKIGSGFICVLPLAQRPRQAVEQFVDRKRAGNKPLLRRIVDNQFQRAAHFVSAELWRGVQRRQRRALFQQPENLPYRLGMVVGQIFADYHHMVDRQHIVLRKP